MGGLCFGDWLIPSATVEVGSTQGGCAPVMVDQSPALGCIARKYIPSVDELGLFLKRAHQEVERCWGGDSEFPVGPDIWVGNSILVKAPRSNIGIFRSTATTTGNWNRCILEVLAIGKKVLTYERGRDGW